LTHTLVVVNIGQLVTMAVGPVPRTGAAMSELGVMEDAALVAVDGEITWIGANDDVEWAGANTVLDARGMAVVPGFVDPHTHLVWAGSREKEFEMRLQGATYMEIMESGGGIHSTVRSTREAKEEDLVIAALARLDNMLSAGTTTVEAKSGYGLDVETEVKCLRAIREVDRRHPSTIVPTFLGAHAVPEEWAEKGGDAYIDHVIEEQLPAVVDDEDGPLAKWCDAFIEEGVFSAEQGERLFEAAKAKGLKIRLHADEFADSGAAALAARVGAASADHLAVASGEGLAAMEKAGVTATLLPGTPFVLRSQVYPDARKMIDMGLPVALATDMNPNCMVDSMPFVMTLACLQMGMTPAEALTASTVNGAHALGVEDRVGSIQVGKRADLVVLDAPGYSHIAYTLNRDIVRAVVKDGHVI
jgi:imidazolonepropionase